MCELYNPENVEWRIIASHFIRCSGNTHWKVSHCISEYTPRLYIDGLKVSASKRLRELRFEPHSVYIIDVERNCKDGHHKNGVHCNVLVYDMGVIHRFEPYYAQTVPETIKLQKALDTFLLDFFCARKLKYRPMLQDARKKCPYGPQILDSSVAKREDFEHYCMVWCCAFVCYLVVNCDHIVSVTSVFIGLAKSWNLKIPKDHNKALEVSNSYLAAIRRYGQTIFNEGKACWQRRKGKRKRS